MYYFQPDVQWKRTNIYKLIITLLKTSQLIDILTNHVFVVSDHKKKKTVTSLVRSILTHKFERNIGEARRKCSENLIKRKQKESNKQMEVVIQRLQIELKQYLLNIFYD